MQAERTMLPRGLLRASLLAPSMLPMGRVLLGLNEWEHLCGLLTLGYLAMLAGLPVVLVLRRAGRLSIYALAIAGAVVGALLHLAVFAYLSHTMVPSGPLEVRMACGNIVAGVMTAVLFGLVGGLRSRRQLAVCGLFVVAAVTGLLLYERGRIWSHSELDPACEKKTREVLLAHGTKPDQWTSTMDSTLIGAGPPALSQYGYWSVGRQRIQVLCSATPGDFAGEIGYEIAEPE